jgi:probable phosphoglycerate mutase
MGLFFLIRHAETEWNLQHRLQGHSNIPLNETGRNQAKTLIPWVATLGIKKFVSSDLTRANETAMIAANLKVPVVTDPGIREINLGEGEGRTWNEVEPWLGRDFVEAWASNDAQKMLNLKFPNGETRGELLKRTQKTLIQHLLKSNNETVGFVAHGLLIRTFIHYVAPDLITSFRMPNTGFLPFAFDEKEKFIYLGPKDIKDVIVPMKSLAIDF